MNRYAQKRHQGPTHRGFTITQSGYEGNIPVVVARKNNPCSFFNMDIGEDVTVIHVRAFYCHPTKGWRSTGPEGRR